MRLFIAILLSEKMKNALLTCMDDLRWQGVKGNYVAEKNLHLTLAFIGEYDDPDKVNTVIGSIPEPDFQIRLSECGNFGNLLWAGMEESRELDTYVKELRKALKDAGVPYDKKRFVPHITLVRKADKSPRGIQPAKAGMRVKKAWLMKSEIKDGKVTYTAIPPRK